MTSVQLFIVISFWDSFMPEQRTGERASERVHGTTTATTTMYAQLAAASISPASIEPAAVVVA